MNARDPLLPSPSEREELAKLMKAAFLEAMNYEAHPVQHDAAGEFDWLPVADAVLAKGYFKRSSPSSSEATTEPEAVAWAVLTADGKVPYVHLDRLVVEGEGELLAEKLREPVACVALTFLATRDYLRPTVHDARRSRLEIIEAICALHRCGPEMDEVGAELADPDCVECGSPYPCPTLEALGDTAQSSPSSAGQEPWDFPFDGTPEGHIVPLSARSAGQEVREAVREALTKLADEGTRQLEPIAGAAFYTDVSRWRDREYPALSAGETETRT